MQKTNKNYFKKLLAGEVPLFISFWIWFIFATFLMEFFFDINFSENIYIQQNTKDKVFQLFVYFFSFLYSIFIFLVIFRSSNKYIGNKLWSFLAKVFVTINLFFSLTILSDIIKFYFLEDYSIKKEIDEFRSNLPIKIDKNSELIDINKEKKYIKYIYKFYNIEKLNKLSKHRFKKQVQDSLCEDESTLNLLKKDYILDYKYIDKNGTKIISILTDKTACGKGIYDLDILEEILRQRGEL